MQGLRENSQSVPCRFGQQEKAGCGPLHCKAGKGEGGWELRIMGYFLPARHCAILTIIKEMSTLCPPQSCMHGFYTLKFSQL